MFVYGLLLIKKYKYDVKKFVESKKVLFECSNLVSLWIGFVNVIIRDFDIVDFIVNYLFEVFMNMILRGNVIELLFFGEIGSVLVVVIFSV